MKVMTLLAMGLALQVSAAQLPFESEADRAPTFQTGGSCLIKAGRVITVTGDTLKDAEIWIENGKIKAIGKSLKGVPSTLRVIDARDKVAMPGIVDAHLHRGTDATNEGTDAITCEVRIRDVIDPSRMNIWQALASGETAGCLLHGSANPIGGESVVVKLKYRRPADEMPIPDAPRMVKFALGENVTRASSDTSTRFPNSRMGVEAVYRRAFTEAQKYIDAWASYDKERLTNKKAVPPRKDVRLETLADILKGKVWVQCHSYRADEIFMMARLSKEFGFKIGAMQHALEAYKVAPDLAKMGIPVSMFSDNWSFKLEGYDAIPAGPALCMRAGVLTSVNTDGTGGTTTIIYDAAKLIREGGLTEKQALSAVTINPAKQLGIDHRTGSLEVGKDADITLWDGHPFSVHSKCVMSMIEGEVYFERRDKFGVGTSSESTLDLPIPKSHQPDRVPKLASRYALTGATVHPVSGPAIAGGTVLIEDGKITAVGRNVDIPNGTVTVRLNGKHVYPGFIDAGTAMGLAEISPIPVSVDLNETGDFQADLVAATAVNRDSAHFGAALTHGVLTTMTRPGGSLIGGQASLMNTWGWTSDAMALRRYGGLVVSLPSSGGRRFGNEACACFGPTLQELWDGIPHQHVDEEEDLGGQPQGRQFQQEPVDFEGRMKVLSDYFDKAIKYGIDRQRKPLETPRDLGLEAMQPYVTGKLPVLLRTRGIQSIRNGISFAKQYKIKAVLVGANDAWKIADEVKASGLPVIVTLAGESTLGGNSPSSQYDPYDSPFAVPGLLQKAGIPFGIQTESNAQSFSLAIQAGMQTAYGISSEDMIYAMTLGGARALYCDDLIGSLEPGKCANIVVVNGNPLESTTSVTMAFVAGRPVELVSKHTRLRDEYARQIEGR